MYYYYQKAMFLELRHDSMSYYAANQQHHIFSARNMDELVAHLSPDSRFDVAVLDDRKTIVYASSPDIVFPFRKGFVEYKHHYFYLDTLELEHLKHIRYIVIRANTFEPLLEQTRRSIYLFLLFSIVFLSAVIYTLSKLFLQPVRDAISKLDRFIRDTTHELNTPLSVITMSVEQLKQKPIDPSLGKQIGRIDIASRTITNLYNDLTFLLMYDRSPNDIRRIDLAELLHERIEYFRPIAEGKKIVIASDLHPASLSIDRSKMTQLIDNLLSNAIKYNKPAGRIDLLLEPGSLTVRDTGVGIPEEHIDQIFNRYTRFDEATGGFGIGLSIIQMVCSEFGLDVRVDSRVGEGTSFTVSWSESSH